MKFNHNIYLLQLEKLAYKSIWFSWGIIVRILHNILIYFFNKRMISVKNIMIYDYKIS